MGQLFSSPASGRSIRMTEADRGDLGALLLVPLLCPIGFILLWSSRAWSLPDKVVGTIAIPCLVPIVVWALDHARMARAGAVQGPDWMVVAAGVALAWLILFTPYLARRRWVR